MFYSIFNDVLGPIMRGPSSSHTAGSYHIARVVRDLLGAEPVAINITFDPNGSYGKTYVQQGVDQAFVTGLMGWKQTDQIFTVAIDTATKKGVEITFQLKTLPQADHPNYAIIEATAKNGETITVAAKSVGGGTFKIVTINDATCLLNGKNYVTLLTIAKKNVEATQETIAKKFPQAGIRLCDTTGENLILQLNTNSPISLEMFAALPSIETVRQARPVYYTQQGLALFISAQEMLDYCTKNKRSLGQAVLDFEKTILGISEEKAIQEMLARYRVMRQAVRDGLDSSAVNMLLLEPMAATIHDNITQKKVAIGGIHATAAARAMAALHTCNSRGVVCAAPTGGAAGTLPGVLTALDDAYNISDRQMAHMLFAAGGIGLILAIRGTFAAEIAGCQVEIGAAGAMGAAAVVEFAGGTAQQACDAAAISFQNTMGSVCDLVQGMCEIPCHTRNAVAASSAFTNADMVIGGYLNHINLDETIDAVYASGRMLPGELRCTALGGLALAPSALALSRNK